MRGIVLLWTRIVKRFRSFASAEWDRKASPRLGFSRAGSGQGGHSM